MSLGDSERLHRLGAGESIADLCTAAGCSLEELQAWWREQAAARVPPMDGEHRAPLDGAVEIGRDQWGIPHILAQTDQALFYGYGYAMAQDRLWQLDYYRRKARGRLAEVLGASGLASDQTVRTMDIPGIAARGMEAIAAKSLQRLEAFAAGINGMMEACRDNLPLEFALLDYAPEPWTALDSVAVWREFQWYLTGRLPVIALPELARQTLGEGPLWEAFIEGEAEDESIVPPGSYAPGRVGAEAVGRVLGDPEEGAGSNNWAVDGSRSASGAPLVATDPHIAFGAVSCWYEAHLSGPELHVAGTAYLGFPAIFFGRNETMAWGLTNNICSQRDLYREQTDAAHPGCFRYDGQWERATVRREIIQVKDADPVELTVSSSRNGPIVDELLPGPLRHTGPVACKWVGASASDELSCLLALNAAPDCAAVRAALEPWVLPTLSMGFADTEGHIGYQAIGRIPLRDNWRQGYRPGWDPKHQWQSFIPYKGLPALADPEQGYVRSANNRGAPPDFPYPLSGTWNSGYRAQRIRGELEQREGLTRADFLRLQLDVLSLRAVDAVPGLVAALRSSGRPRVQEAAGYLDDWDCRMETDRVGAALFDVFFAHWCRAIAMARFDGEAVELLAGAASGLAVRLLQGDPLDWFKGRPWQEVAVECMELAIEELEGRLGADMAQWQWGRIHTVALPHLLSGRGDLGQLLDRGGDPVRGNGITICNTGFDPNYLAAMGANWRHTVDLGEEPAALWAVDAAGQSGHVGSPHYGDQLASWLANEPHCIVLDEAAARATVQSWLVLGPQGVSA
ncbi:MAG: hypothetical protein GKR89_13825 [Candidatus Latescibacteria bacterium]|nr:hypothetical protein [Candidatus Latescibacterota bacterium]